MTTSAASSPGTPTVSSLNSPSKESSPPDPPPSDSLNHGLVDLIAHGLRVACRVTVPVRGRSMLPTLTPGQRVVVHRVPERGVRTGDVVAMRYQGGLVVHRVLDRSASWLTTAGDNLSLYDPPVPVTDVIGVIPGLPPRPSPRPWRPAVGSGPIDVWLVSTGAQAERTAALPTSWRVRVRPGYGIGVSDAVLRELRASVAGHPCVGITEHAVDEAGDVLTEPLPAGSRVIVGCAFGTLDTGLPGSLLPPKLADVYVRCGPPGVRQDPGEALARLATVTNCHRAEDRL